MATAKKPEVKEEAPAALAAAPVQPIGYTTLEPDDLRRVNVTKKLFDETITYLSNLRDSYHDAETQRAFSVAITHAETASMWAVKAITRRS